MPVGDYSSDNYCNFLKHKKFLNSPITLDYYYNLTYAQSSRTVNYMAEVLNKSVCFILYGNIKRGG